MARTEPEVEEDAAHHRFLLTVDGQTGQLVYREHGGQIHLVHTEVPEGARHRGLGGRLVLAAVDRARRTGEVVVPSCPFARHWLKEHRSAATGVRIDWSDPQETRR